MVEMAKAADILELVNLRLREQENDWSAEGYEISEELRKATEDCFRERMGKDLQMFVIRKNNKIVATATLLLHNYMPQADEITGKRAYLCNVWTIPEERRNGLQKEMFKHLKKFCSRKGIKRIDLHSTETEEARKMWESFGVTFRGNGGRLFI